MRGRIWDSLHLKTCFWDCRMKETFTIVEDGVRRAAAGVDSRFDVSGKASRAAHGWVGQSTAQACLSAHIPSRKAFQRLHDGGSTQVHLLTAKSQTPGEEALQKAVMLHTATSYWRCLGVLPNSGHQTCASASAMTLRVPNTYEGRRNMPNIICSGRRRSIACRVKEQAEAVEYKLGLRRKLRILAEDTQRRLPQVDALEYSTLTPS